MASVVAHDGTRIDFDDVGRGAQSVVLLHGMACDRSHMSALADHLSTRFRCVNVDVRGHGQSDKPHDAYAMHEFHADIDLLVDTLGLGAPIVIGHSFGGSIGLAYTHRDPSRVRALVMLDSGMRSNATVTADLGPFYAALRSGDYEATLHQFVLARLVDPVDGETFAKTISAGMARVPSHVFLSMSDTVQQLRSAEMASELTSVPALFVSSRQAFADAAALAALGPNWHKGQVVGAGHFVQLIAPDQVHAMVDRFLEVEGLGA